MRSIVHSPSDYEYAGIITKYNGKDKHIVLSSTINERIVGFGGIPVTEIGKSAFHCNSTIETVWINANVKIIRAGAFWFCDSLKELKLPNCLEEIEMTAFGGCIKLNEVKLPHGLKKIGDNAFLECYSLYLAYVPASVTHIGEYAFDKCLNLTLVVEKDSCAEEYAKENKLNYMYSDDPALQEEERL
jgi:hypothetical protein